MSDTFKRELARRALQKKKAAEPPSFELAKHLFDKQLAFALDPAQFKTAVCSRRAGKSEECVADLIDTAMKFERINCAYITLARTSAKRIIWPLFKRVLKDHNIDVKYDNSELTIEFPNGSFIYVGGAKDLSEVEKYRGMSFKKVYVDEAQSFRQSILSVLIDDVIVPALWDVKGTLCLIGTPGPVPNGLFYDMAHNPAWSNHKWTMLDNPWIKKKSGMEPEEILALERKRKGISADDPSYRREALGEWVLDFDSLVYKFNSAINICEDIPKGLTYVFGIDVGFNDKDAIAVLGYNFTDQHVYLVEELVTAKQDITALVEQIKMLREKYKPVKMVMDAGALGKKIQEEILNRHSLPIEAADKNRKHEFIDLLNGDLRTGKFKAFKGSEFEEDSYLTVWDREDPVKPKISDRYHTDIGDAVLYAWRECKHFIPKDAVPDNPHPTSNAYMDAHWAKLAAEMADAEQGEWAVSTAELKALFDEG